MSSAPNHLNLIIIQWFSFQLLRLFKYEHSAPPNIRCQVIEIGGMEIDAHKIQPFNTAAADIDNYIVRLGEITKRMLYRTVIKAKSTKESMTFGVMTYSSIAEHCIHQYHPPKPSLASTSASDTSKLIQRCTLPTLSSTQTYRMLSLEYIMYCKKLLEDSLAQNSDTDKPYLFSYMDTGTIPTIFLFLFHICCKYILVYDTHFLFFFERTYFSYCIVYGNRINSKLS